MIVLVVRHPHRCLTAADQDVANMLLALQEAGGAGRQQGRHLWANRIRMFYEFYNLGLGDPIAVSAVHGHGTGDLLEAVRGVFPGGGRGGRG